VVTAVDHEPNPIDAPGTDEAEWRAWDGLRRLRTLDLAAWRDVVVIAAHPDDEVLGVGGLMALLADRGARLRLVAVTDGEASHPDLPGQEIAARRIAESAAALTHIGEVETVRLGLPDSGVREEDLRKLLPELVEGFDVCLAPWEEDVHRDHEAAGRAASACGIDVWHFPIWTWHWAGPAHPGLPWERAVGVPLPPEVAARKQAAIGCFDSQFEEPDPILPPGILAHFTRPQEVLFHDARA
jgi:LmbE family N-acetylglucosaminyl deacetylase